jgi:acetyl-CoA carboxylase beta subunit
MWEGNRIRIDTGQLDTEWEGTDFMVCSKCKQVVRKEEIQRNWHVCWHPREIISTAILS